jgi:hypothetical protein
MLMLSNGSFVNNAAVRRIASNIVQRLNTRGFAQMTFRNLGNDALTFIHVFSAIQLNC